MKESRREKILELIEKEEISTQEELTARLNDFGYKTTQATVSRDINALKLQKIPSQKGQKYIFPETRIAEKDKYQRIFSDAMIKMEQAGNLLVIKTISGMAMAAAAALDELRLEEIVGSIAGDDTIMCACRSNEETVLLINKINKILKA